MLNQRINNKRIAVSNNEKHCYKLKLPSSLEHFLFARLGRVFRDTEYCGTAEGGNKELLFTFKSSYYSLSLLLRAREAAENQACDLLRISMEACRLEVIFEFQASIRDSRKPLRGVVSQKTEME